MTTHRIELEATLAEDQWIRRMAHQLVRDPNQADDLAQEAWLVALGAQRAEAPSSAWLRGVLGNLRRHARRSDGRRAARERASAREESQPSAAEVASELTLRKHVTDSLLELSEPYRSSLYLRFFKELSLEALAQEQGISISTAHRRIEEGLTRMRGKLDRSYGDDRRAWCLGLVSLSNSEGGAPPVIGGLLMTTAAKVAVPLLLVAGSLYWIVDSMLEGESLPKSPAGLSSGSPEVEPPQIPIEQGSADKGQRVALSDTEEATPELAIESQSVIHGLVIDRGRQPLANVKVGFETEAEGTTSQTDGRFALPWNSEEAPPDVVSHDPQLHTLIAGRARGEAPAVVVVAARHDFAGRVLDAEGDPIPGARVVFQVRQDLFRKLAINRPAYRLRAGSHTSTDREGLFQLSDMAGGEGVCLEVTASGFDTELVDLPDRSDLDLLITLERELGILLRGVVLDARGAPVEGATVAAGHKATQSDAQGGFELPWNPHQQDEFEATRPGQDHLVALKRGHGPVRRAIASLDTDAPLTLILPEQAQTLRGHVVDGEGQPVPDAMVWIHDLTRCGERRVSTGDTAAIFSLFVEEELNDSGRAAALSDENGAFEIGGLLPRDYQLQAISTQSLETSAVITAAADEDSVELQLEAHRTSRVAGRLLSAEGDPLVGVEITPRPSRAAGRIPQLSASTPCVTDDEGAFAFERLAIEDIYLQLWSPTIGYHNRGLPSHQDLGKLEITVLIQCELQIDWSGLSPEAFDALRILDDEHQALTIHESYGTFTAMLDEIERKGEQSGVLRVKESARTLILMRGEEEVGRRNLDLNPSELTTLKL